MAATFSTLTNKSTNQPSASSPATSRASESLVARPKRRAPGATVRQVM